MAKRRVGVVPLPEGVQVVKSRGREYFYWAPGRGTKNAGPRVRLPDDPRQEEFWRALRTAQGTPDGKTFASLIAQYTQSPEWNRLRDASKKDYRIYLGTIESQWGNLPVNSLRPVHVIALRDTMSETPVAANHMLSILRTIIKWGIPREYSEANPARDVERLKVDDSGATPWPEDAYRFVLANAWEDIRRAVFLCRNTGQRIGDVCRMRPADRHQEGIRLTISKRRDKAHWVPLSQEAIVEIDSWEVEPMKPFFMTPRGGVYTQQKFGARWQRWRKSDEAKPIRDQRLTIHGLRAMAVCDRRATDITGQKIAAQLGMSLQMVQRYSRFGDQMEMAR